MNQVTKLPRLIQGEILKCVDGRDTTREEQTLPLGTQLFVRGMTRALQCWKGRLARAGSGGEQAALPPPTDNSGNDGAAAKPAEPAKKSPKKKQAVPGKPVKPVSLAEELNDEIGF